MHGTVKLLRVMLLFGWTEANAKSVFAPHFLGGPQKIQSKLISAKHRLSLRWRYFSRTFEDDTCGWFHDSSLFFIPTDFFSDKFPSLFLIESNVMKNTDISGWNATTLVQSLEVTGFYRFGNSLNDVFSLVIYIDWVWPPRKQWQMNFYRYSLLNNAKHVVILVVTVPGQGVTSNIYTYFGDFFPNMFTISWEQRWLGGVSSPYS